jgi:eukaryotic-like serine/threonine-protein kinase
MGEVYAAHDMELGERVALKLLHPHLAEQPSFLDRFRREIRLARRISHGNVARVFDLVQSRNHPLGELNFFVMELLDGETLAARLKKTGLMPPEVALPIACQMASGLAAAHSVGVIHRDFKPANVMLSGDRAVVTDFGLAAAIESGGTEASLSTSSLFMGTPGYVAPEQWAGKPASVATDVYAFGIVLHEMVAGRHPKTPEGAGPPPQWAQVIDKCLELEPRNRWQAMEEVIHELARTGARRRSIRDDKWRPWSTRRQVVTGLAFGSAAVVGGVYWAREWMTPLRLTKGAVVLYGGVANATGDPEFAGLDELMRTQLEQSAQFVLARPQAIGSILKMMASPASSLPAGDTRVARQVAWRGGMALFVHGALTRIGDGFVLTFSMEQPAANAEQPARSWVASFPAASKRAIFEAAHDAARWMRRTSGENAEELAARDRKPEDATTPSWEALDYFTQAMRLREKQQFADAIVLLKRAVEKDSDFASAWMRLGDSQITQRQYVEGYNSWSAALGALERRKVSLREELLLKTQFALDARDAQMADENSRLYTLYYPDRYDAHFLRGLTLAHSKRPHEALGAFGLALAKEPSAFPAVGQTAWACFGIPDWDRLSRETARIRQLGYSVWGDFIDAVGQLVRGEWDRSRSSFERLAASPDAYLRSRSIGAVAQICYEQNEPDKAREWLNKGLFQDRQSGNAASGVNKLLALAHLEWKQGNTAAAISAISTGLEMEAGPTRLMRSAGLYARLHQPQPILELERRVPRLDRVRVFAVARHRLRGEYLYAVRRFDEALVEFQKASDLDLPAYPKEYLPRTLNALGRNLDADKMWLTMQSGLGYLASLAEEQDPDTFASLRRASGRK